jgi:hypothetical protein
MENNNLTVAAINFRGFAPETAGTALIGRDNLNLRSF